MTMAELEQYAALSKLSGFRRKVEQARQVVSEMLAACARPYVAFSGGKDSTVVLHLVLEQRPDVDVAFFDSGAEFPDTLAFVEQLTSELSLNMTILEPQMTLLEIYELAGWWGSAAEVHGIPAGEIQRILIGEPSRWMRDAGCDGVFMGLRAEESWARRGNYVKRGRIYHADYTGMTHCQPIVTWKAADVWAYIASRGLKYNAVYDKHWPGGREAIRVGAYAGSDNATLRNGRWVFVKRHYPNLWREFVGRFPDARFWA